MCIQNHMRISRGAFQLYLVSDDFCALEIFRSTLKMCISSQRPWRNGDKCLDHV